MRLPLKSIGLFLGGLAPVWEKLEPILMASAPVVVERMLEKFTGTSPQKERQDRLEAGLLELRHDYEHLHKIALALREQQLRQERRLRLALGLAVVALLIATGALVVAVAKR